MNDLLWFLLLIAIWVFIQGWLLPRRGIPT